jgi:general secretion pathway protein D
VKVRVLGLVLLVGLCSRPAVATTVSIQTPPSAVTQGDTFFVDILVAGASDLVAFQFDLAFNPAILSANDPVLEGTFLSDAGATAFFPGFVDNTLGTISFVANALIGNDPGANGGGVLARVSFNAIGTGSATLSLTPGPFGSLIRDANGDLVLDDDPVSPFFGLFAVTFDEQILPAEGSVTVAAPTAGEVPEPSTLLLIGSGLAAAVRRRRVNRTA